MLMPSLISLGKVLVMMGAGLAPAEAAAGQTIMLNCQPQNAEMAQICQQMRNVIAATRPEDTVHVVDAETQSETATMVRLHVEQIKKDAIAAHLAWRQQGDEWRLGDTMAMSVMDRDLNEQMILRFLETLWAESPLGK